MLEWMREWSGSNTTTDEMLEAVRRKLEETFAQVAELAGRRGLTPRESALCLAVQRVADAHGA
jgi:glutamate dehydrogenase/leucine dehydrogenase